VIVPTAVNGRIDEGLLSELPGYDGDLTPHRADFLAAAAYYRMRPVFKAAGLGDLHPSNGYSCYRTLADQVHMRAIGLTTVPVGKSIHGEAKAIDFQDVPFGSARHNWLKAHGAEFGFYQPPWAQRGGSLPESWHWEYDADLDSSTPPPDPAPVHKPEPVPEPEEPEMCKCFLLYRINEDGRVFIGGPGKWDLVTDVSVLPLMRVQFGTETAVSIQQGQHLDDTFNGRGND
jgi:hypothetical protein